LFALEKVGDLTRREFSPSPATEASPGVVN
jgi:hypothetical protein